MALPKKPSSATEPAAPPAVSDEAVRDFAEGALGRTNGNGTGRRKKRLKLEKKLRFYSEELLTQLEDAVERDPVGRSANQWILEAIKEKLDRELQNA